MSDVFLCIRCKGPKQDREGRFIEPGIGYMKICNDCEEDWYKHVGEIVWQQWLDKDEDLSCKC